MDTQKSLVDYIDGSTVAHVLIIGIVLLIVYHVLFVR